MAVTGPGFMGGPANQPQHPDFFALSDVILKMDGDADEGGVSTPDALGEVVDFPTLMYVIDQRLLRIEMAQGFQLSQRSRITMSAIYLEAFLMGAKFQQRKVTP